MMRTRFVIVFFLVSVSVMVAFIVAWMPQQTSDVSTTPEAIVFDFQPEVVERGGEVMLHWAVSGVDSVVIQQRYGSYKQVPDFVYGDFPPEGTFTVNLGESPVPYIHNVSFWLLTPGEGSSAWILGYTFLKGVDVPVRCPYDGFFFGHDPYYEYCPLAEAQTVAAVYQLYENGFLLWRGDNHTIYVFRVYDNQPSGSALRFTGSTMDDVPPPPPESPADHATPDAVFRRFLDENRTHGIIIGLGSPTAAGVTYQAIVQDSYNDTLYDAVSYMRLPDNRVIRYLEDLYGANWLCMTCQDISPTQEGN